MIQVFQPRLGEEELSAVAEVFASNWIGHGPRTKAFEALFAAHLGVEPDRLVFINCATAGLFLGMELLGLGAGDEVVLPSVSFVAAANAVADRGARPVFCDVDPQTLNPTAADVARVLTPRTKAVLLLHYGGRPGDVAAVAGLCRERGVALIEDAACAVSSHVDGRAAGTFGDLAVWSFDAMKMLVCGDGGMLYVRDPDRAARARRLAYHGLARPSGFGQAGAASSRWWDLDVPEVGRRIVGNDLTAAIGTVQLRRLPGFVARRKQIVELYDRELADVPGLTLPPPLPEGHHSSYYFYWVQMDPGVRDEVARDLYAAGVYTTFRYPLLHRVPLYGATGQLLPHADEAAERTLCLPLHNALDDSDVRTVAAALRKAMEARAGR
ncbi:DegT/DnrJ/EryC1/StrS family aminotransferase [Streptomyces caniscabiei]|uniref:DegT/DnrJ/EryC1/StrS family aminotransferase n=1 Tax=Streptomyces caniscabiei TaxID=2746961 RepID=UPI0029A07A18|nr:DegT/DnrJ/EryC1/StrS family aminotransferase [Streptomyces caniscabiei]MDX2600831.1 DegT/DnrJ/EryC1/StrS family aminotransferase [Streptomyces caniscabiei]MDX2741429.1 DegT/DnrJ/EryC1/StrS family aminotransferase [Streptomyces caniscabiei]MDX2781355.1 DegT/DnrJ/EryC1/StrS family aminotransferase [Streptomyces caniscabiei]